MKTRCAALAVAALAAVLAAALWYAMAGRGARPNVVLISIDTLRPDHLGCYGYHRDTSPALDKLAAEGVRFSSAYSHSSWTLPSHMTMMTSLHPSQHRVGPEKRALADSVFTLAQVLSVEGYETAGFVSWVYLARVWGFARGFAKYVEIWGAPEREDDPSGGAGTAEAVTDAAVKWLAGKPREPFFLFLHYFDPHMNYAAPAPYDSMFDPEYTGPARGEWSWLGPYIRWMNEEPRLLPPRDTEHVVALYDGEIRYVDAQMERLIAQLEETFGLDECLVVFTSDHGEEFNDHGSMEGHGWTLYDEVLRVPLVLRWPSRLPGGLTVDRGAGLIDLAPTVLDLLNVPIPGQFQGRSLWELMREAPRPGYERSLFAETHRFNRKRCVRRGRFKLIHTDDTGTGPGGVRWAERWELYDVVADSGETRNLWGGDEAAGEALAAELRRFASGASPAGPGKAVHLTERELELLRSLGYLR